MLKRCPIGRSAITNRVRAYVCCMSSHSDGESCSDLGVSACSQWPSNTGIPVVDVSHMATEEAAEEVLSAWRKSMGLAVARAAGPADPAVLEAPATALLYWEKIPMFDHVITQKRQLVGPGRYCSPRQTTQFEPSCLEFKGIP